MVHAQQAYISGFEVGGAFHSHLLFRMWNIGLTSGLDLCCSFAFVDFSVGGGGARWVRVWTGKVYDPEKQYGKYTIKS